MGAPRSLLPAVLLVASFVACGGGAHPATPLSTTLDYADPADATQWRLVKDASSTPSHLVLDLQAPTGASGMGVTLVLDVDGARASWGSVGGADLAATAVYAGPLARKTSPSGSALRLLMSQENPTPPIAYSGAAVLKVALDLGPGVPPGPVSLTATQAGHLAAPQALPTPITVAVGTLAAR